MRVGIDIGGTKMLLLARGTRGETIERVPTSANFSPQQAEDAIAHFAASLEEPIASLGIAVPGIVDADGTVIACDVLPAFTGWAPRSRMREYGGVTVLNDTEAALQAEMATGEPAGTVAVVMVGTGIGAAIGIDGRSLRRTSAYAGEMGSIPVGHRAGDTLDARASGAAILRMAGMDAAELTRRLAERDPRALQTIRDAGSWLGFGLATVVHLFNPRRVVLGGGTLAWPGYVEAAVERAKERTLPELWATCTVEQTRLGETVVAAGAANVARF
ncbi:MAG TPA: ROK family protein [Candidatus Baltobacteraceae bacterium]|jgi:predicted NBD/HSP70 family sugar kinase